MSSFILPVEIARFVGMRTVYTLPQISDLCRSEALAILFRYVRHIVPISLKDLIANGAIKSAPQQITRVKPEADEWIRAILQQ